MTTKIIVTVMILSIVICQVGKAEKRRYLMTTIGIYLFLK